MSKRFRWRSLLAALLLTALMLPFSPAAQAYSTGQYYEADPSLTMVSTVQIAASVDYYASCVLRDEMVNAGYDCFLYHGSKYYHIMCGKFRIEQDAKACKGWIVSATEYTDAFVTHTYLPDSAIETFELGHYGRSLTPHPKPEPTPCSTPAPIPAPSVAYPATGYAAVGYPAASGSSVPSVAALAPAIDFYTSFEKYQYFEANPRLTMVTTVQVASFEDSDSAESVRDEMARAGYDSFVYHADDSYFVMCGKFNSNSDAEFYRKLILIYSDYTDAVLSTAYLPSSSISFFVSVYYG